jgi:tetratricopeptide (TPR) repeat protein
LTVLGKDAFAGREYGRAARRFRQAIAVYPEEPLAHFLLAQAEFSLGRYVEAVAAIREGMRWRPGWPTAPFRAVDLYGVNAADFRGQQRDLEAALARYPQDTVLLFLLAYQMWFDGRQDEARPLFQRAAALGMDRQMIDRFLQARLGDTVVVK